MKNGTKKWAPIACAVVVILIAAAYLAFFLYAMLEESVGHTGLIVFMAVYCLLILAVVVGVIIALRQRIKEIDGGEEDAASQY